MWFNNFDRTSIAVTRSYSSCLFLCVHIVDCEALWLSGLEVRVPDLSCHGSTVLLSYNFLCFHLITLNVISGGKLFLLGFSETLPLTSPPFLSSVPPFPPSLLPSLPSLPPSLPSLAPSLPPFPPPSLPPSLPLSIYRVFPDFSEVLGTRVAR